MCLSRQYILTIYNQLTIWQQRQPQKLYFALTVNIVVSFTLRCYVPGSDHPAAVPLYCEDDLLVCY
jgi:hypothetical protein